MDTVLTRTGPTGKPVVERRHISFSALDKFTNCPRKFNAYEVTKSIKEPENPNMLEGFKVHKAMAEYISEAKPLPPEYARYAIWPDTLITGKTGEEVLTEHRLACTFNLEPCDYFSRRQKVWLRAQADLLTINGDTAVNIDWKTGKEPDPRYELLTPGFQLRLTAMLIFLHFPKVMNINSQYVYLNDEVSRGFDMTREDLRLFIPQLYDVASGLQRAVRANVWPPRPSGLCKKHCGVTSCEYWGKGNR